MIYFIISMAFVVGIVIASLLWARDVKDKEHRAGLTQKVELHTKPPFRRAPSVLLESEVTLFKILKYVIAEDGHVLAKVQLASLVTMAPGRSRREFYLNIVKLRHVDFVICHIKSLAPVLVIQAMDTGIKISSEEQELVQKVLDAASLPLLKLSVRESLGPLEMKQRIRDAMNQIISDEESSTAA